MNNTSSPSEWKERFEEELGNVFELIYQCPKREGFKIVCANEKRDKTTRKSILEKVGVCPSGSCYTDPNEMDYAVDKIWDVSEWGLSPNCTTLTHFEDPWNSEYDDLTISLYDKSECSGSVCARDGKIVGQCLRLDFEGYYGKSVYIGDLCYRAGAGCYFPSGFVEECEDVPPNLYVFVCRDGVECYDNGNGWQMIEGPEDGAFESENAFVTVKINKKVKMIDICPLNKQYDPDTAPHKIAWVKFNTNDPDV